MERKLTDKDIYCTNIIYISTISKIGGVESFAYYMAKKYHEYDIMVLCKAGNHRQLERIRNYCPAIVHTGQRIHCDKMIINYDTSILDYVDEGEVYMTIHADYTQPFYTSYPNFNHPKIKKVLSITDYIRRTIKEKFHIESELCYNPLIPELIKKRIVLVSATRLNEAKGGKRMQKLAEELDASRNKLHLVHLHKRRG